MKIICNGSGMAIKVNPFSFSHATPAVGMNNFESYQEFEKDNERLIVVKNKKIFTEIGVFEATLGESYNNVDGEWIYDKERPYHGRNMGYKVFDVYYITEDEIIETQPEFSITKDQYDLDIQLAETRGRKEQSLIGNAFRDKIIEIYNAFDSTPTGTKHLRTHLHKFLMEYL